MLNTPQNTMVIFAAALIVGLEGMVELSQREGFEVVQK
jgi:hypothetical protein